LKGYKIPVTENQSSTNEHKKQRQTFKATTDSTETTSPMHVPPCGSGRGWRTDLPHYHV